MCLWRFIENELVNILVESKPQDGPRIRNGNENDFGTEAKTELNVDCDGDTCGDIRAVLLFSMACHNCGQNFNWTSHLL